MRAEDVMDNAICAATEGRVICQGVWFRNPQAAPPDRASILWRLSETDFTEYLDGPEAETKFFELESRTPTIEVDGRVAQWQGYKNSRQNAERVAEYLRGKEILTHRLGAYDEPFDSSQESGGYFSHIIIVGLPAEIDDDLALDIESERKEYD